MGEIKKMKSQKGGEMITLDNYLYNKDKQLGDDKTRWRCKKRTCRGALILSNNLMDIMDRIEHNHPPESNNSIQSLLFKSNLKQNARESRDKSLNVVLNAIGGINEKVIQNLPKDRSLIKTVHRVRSKDIPGFVPSIPEIPESLLKNERGE